MTPPYIFRLAAFHTPGGRWQRKNEPIEVKFSRRVVEDADPYGVRFDMLGRFKNRPQIPEFHTPSGK